ncbi:hypothetical protein ACLOJK_037007 [Asimina triloba]
MDRTYRHIDFSPIAITLAAEENWLTLSTTTTAPRPSRKAVYTIFAASPAPWCLHKASSAPVVAITTPRPSRKVTLIAVVTTPTSVVRPSYKATISATPAPRPPRKVISALVSATTVP